MATTVSVDLTSTEIAILLEGLRWAFGHHPDTGPPDYAAQPYHFANEALQARLRRLQDEMGNP